jgi:N-methylhydantoinase A
VQGTADGILKVVRATMARAIRSVSIERGRDVRRFALVAFGGAGPLHATALARELEIASVVVPPAPGALAALGLLVASRRADASLSRPMRCDRTSDAELRSILHELTEQVLSELAAEGINFAQTNTSLVVDCRYEGQSHELRIPVRGGPSFTLLAEAFHLEHYRRFGFARERVPVEAVTFRAGALGPAGEFEKRVPAGRPELEPIERREIDGRDVPVYARADLAPGIRMDGPALVVELDSTTWVDDASSATVHSGGALIIEVGVG